VSVSPLQLQIKLNLQWLLYKATAHMEFANKLKHKKQKLAGRQAMSEEKDPFQLFF